MENMTDYISREAAKLRIFEYGVRHRDNSSISFACENLKRQMNAIPAADVRPVVKAHWTNHRTIEHDGEWYCTACGKEITIYMGADRKDRYKFCPNCGADMRGEIAKDTTSGCGKCYWCRLADMGVCRYGEAEE